MAVLLTSHADPQALAELAKGRLRSKLPLLEQALTGLVRHHHRQLLALQLAPIDFLEEQLDTLSAEITRLLTELSAVPPAQPPAAAAERVGQAQHRRASLRPIGCVSPGEGHSAPHSPKSGPNASGPADE